MHLRPHHLCLFTSKLLVVLTITYMAPIPSTHAMDKENFQESSLSSNLSRPDFANINESVIYTGSMIWSGNPNWSLSSGMGLEESIAPNERKSYLWGYLRDLGDMYSAISNNLSGLTWPSIPYFSTQSPANNPPAYDLDALIEEFLYLDDPLKESESNTQG